MLTRKSGAYTMCPQPVGLRAGRLPRPLSGRVDIPTPPPGCKTRAWQGISNIQEATGSRHEALGHIADLTTVAWFCIFIVGFMAFDADLVGLEPLIKIPESYQTAWTVVNWSIWAVFAVDVWFKYRRIWNPREFVRRHWFDLLLLIPVFRVLAVLRVLRLLRMLRLARAGLGAYKAYRQAKRLRGSEK